MRFLGLVLIVLFSSNLYASINLMGKFNQIPEQEVRAFLISFSKTGGPSLIQGTVSDSFGKFVFMGVDCSADRKHSIYFEDINDSSVVGTIAWRQNDQSESLTVDSASICKNEDNVDLGLLTPNKEGKIIVNTDTILNP